MFSSTITILAAPVQPDFGAMLTVVQNGTLTLTNTAACLGTLVWGRTNGDMATGGVSFSLSNGQSNMMGSFTVNAPGTYMLTVVNATGQTASTVSTDTSLPTLCPHEWHTDLHPNEPDTHGHLVGNSPALDR